LAALEQGVIFRPLPGDVLAMSPPFVISDEQIDTAIVALDRAIQAVAKEL
jgi:adenosylmethionine-8-amino-7-oxononanoate aminotransferase